MKTSIVTLARNRNIRDTNTQASGHKTTTNSLAWYRNVPIGRLFLSCPFRDFLHLLQ